MSAFFLITIAVETFKQKKTLDGVLAIIDLLLMQTRHGKQAHHSEI